MEKPWLKHYRSDIPHEIDLEKFGSLVEVIDEAFQKYGTKPAFTCMGKTLRFQDLEEQSRHFAAFLSQVLGMQKGDRIAIMMPNILQYPVVLFGALRAGITIVNVNPLYTARELKHQLIDSGAKAIVIVENFAATLAQVINETPVKDVVLTGIGDMLGFPKGMIVNWVLKHLKKMVPPHDIPHFIRLDEALQQGTHKNFEAAPANREDIAFLQYTGGTTGLSKGAMLSHGNIIANVLQASAWLNQEIEPGNETIITALPLYHIFSLTANCVVFMYFGGHNILITNPRDIPGFVKTLQKHPFTAITAVNTLFNALLQNETFKTLDFSPLKISLGGGMAVQKPVADRWLQVTGKPISQAYGLTETSPAVCMNPLELTEFNGTIGLPLSSTAVSIRDDQEQAVPIGEPGELCVRGPQVMKGYWQRAEETGQAFTKDGWFKTGDIATMDESGFFTIVDRKKDMIIVSGFNVFPNEVEEVAATHPGVLEVAAVGVPDAKSGEAVKLFVVKKDASLSETDLLDFCRKGLTGYKIPRYVEFRSELPKTNVGKILRRSLRENAG